MPFGPGMSKRGRALFSKIRYLRLLSSTSNLVSAAVGSFSLLGLSSMSAYAQTLPDTLLPEGVGLTEIFSFAAFIASFTFAAVSCFILMRSRNALTKERDELANSLADYRTRSDRFEALIAADDQRLVIWPRKDDAVTVIGNLPDICETPRESAAFLAFGNWLTMGSAVAVERAIVELREDGVPFHLAITSKTGRYLDAYGKTVGGRAFVRFRDLTGDRQVMAQLQRQFTDMSQDLESIKALFEQMDQPVWLNRMAESSDDGEKEMVRWSNGAYLASVDAENEKGSAPDLLDLETREEIKRTHETGRPFVKRVNAIASGARRTFDVVSVPTHKGYACIATDVSEAEQAQAALNRTIKSHEKTLNELATAVAIFDKDHRLIFHNKAYQELFGLDLVFLASKPTDSEVIDKLRSLGKLPVEANFRAWKNTLLETHQSIELQEFTWHLPHGQTLRVVASPRSAGGVTWIYEDVTAQLTLESQVNVLSRLQNETLNRLAEGVSVFSSDGRLTLSNAAFAAQWGLTNEFLKKKPKIETLIEACSSRHDVAEDWEALRLAVVGVSEQPTEAQGRLERKDGSVLDYGTVALIDGRTMITFMDVTDTVNVERALVEKNEALQHADKLKSDFVQHVSYELRSPLTNIIGFTQLLFDADIGPLTDKQKEYTDYILASSSSLLAIINDILDLATTDAGALELELTKISVESAIANAVGGLQDRFNERRIALRTDIEDDIGEFIGDENRVVQVLFNLLSNAIHFSHDDSDILLKVRREDKEIVFEVQDWGAGIPETFLQSIFDRFESRPTGAARGGVGLGLSIVKRFVEMHGGSVAATSEQGVGTTITCRFPIEPDAMDVAAE